MPELAWVSCPQYETEVIHDLHGASEYSCVAPKTIPFCIPQIHSPSIIWAQELSTTPSHSLYALNLGKQ